MFRCFTVRVSPPYLPRVAPFTSLTSVVHQPATLNFRRHHASVSHFANTMEVLSEVCPQPAPFKVLILGGCYAGLSAALNLIDLSEGRAARQGNGVVPAHDGKIPVDITIVDERDGYCMCLSHPRERP